LVILIRQNIYFMAFLGFFEFFNFLQKNHKIIFIVLQFQKYNKIISKVINTARTINFCTELSYKGNKICERKQSGD